MGLIARSMEEAGFPTVYLGSCRDIMAQAKPPRAAFVDFPLGRPCGRPGEVELQKRILKDALELLTTSQVPGQIADLPYEWDEPFDWETYRADVEQMIQEEGIEKRSWSPQN